MDYDRWNIILGYVLGFTVLFTACSADKAPSYSFVKPATSAPPVAHYDYIVVGGGTAGCSLTATLSSGATVLLLERGGSPYGNEDIEDMGSFYVNLLNPSLSAPAQKFLSEDGVANIRANILGGGSAINAGFYSRASPAYVGKVGWDYGLVNQSYQWVENKVVFEPPMLQYQTAFRDGLLEAGIRPDNGFTYDHISGTKVGGTIFDKHGHRHTAADLLEYADPRQTTVYLYATAQKILFNNNKGKPRAEGVLYKDSNGGLHKAVLRPGEKNEVIVSSGALGSPQLLMLSGIGPADELTVHGIEVLVNQPQVGQGMSDNPMNALYIPSPIHVETSQIQAVGITDFGSYIEATSGNFSIGVFVQFLQAAAQLGNSKDSQAAEAPKKGDSILTSEDDIQRAMELANAWRYGIYEGGLILEKVDNPRSSGYLHLSSLDPNDTPTVRFNYFEDPEDLQKCVMGMNTIISVIESESYQKFRVPGMSVQTLIIMALALPFNLRPRHLNSAFSMEQFCVDTVLTIWHYHGGCQVNKVVDTDYRVLGTDGLRVIDGSTFYESPGTNPQATVMMLGRYMGQKILAERR